MTSPSEKHEPPSARATEQARAIVELSDHARAEALRHGRDVSLDVDTLLIIGGLIEGLSSGQCLTIRTRAPMPDNCDDASGRTGVVLTYDDGEGRVLHFHARTFLGVLSQIVAPQAWWLPPS